MTKINESSIRANDLARIRLSLIVLSTTYTFMIQDGTDLTDGTSENRQETVPHRHGFSSENYSPMPNVKINGKSPGRVVLITAVLKRRAM
jgi:hypothetical protein